MADAKTKGNKQGMDKDEMCRKVMETVDHNTDAEVRMERDGTYKVFSVIRHKA